MTYTTITYLLYLTISISLTIFVGKSLYRNGRSFLLDIFAEKENLADSLNRLLLVGFYLLNIGYITLNMNSGVEIVSPEHMISKLSYKIGVILLVLGGVHFLNLLVLFRMRKKARTHTLSMG